MNTDTRRFKIQTGDMGKLGKWIEKLGIIENYAIRNGQNFKEGA